MRDSLPEAGLSPGETLADSDRVHPIFSWVAVLLPPCLLGIEPSPPPPPVLEVCRVLTTGPPGKFPHHSAFLTSQVYFSGKPP